MEEILDTINKAIRAENGTRVNMNSLLKEAELDSFGHTMLMLELDDAYGIFADVPEGEDPFAKIEWETMTIKELVEQCM